jgi:hypothetical protein
VWFSPSYREIFLITELVTILGIESFFLGFGVLYENRRFCFLRGISVYNKIFLKVHLHQKRCRIDSLLNPYEIILDIFSLRKRAILLENIVNWLDHYNKIRNKSTNKVDNAHKGLNLLSRSGGWKVHNSNDPFGIYAYP